jgi:ATP-dependent Clp protease protease subunit
MAAAKTIDDAEMLISYGIHIPSRTIMLTGEVDQDMYETLIMGLTLITNSKGGVKETIKIELNSEGGCWYSGVAIYDRIKSCKAPVDVLVSGSAMSMGSVILQSGDRRLITPNSTVMVHDGSESMDGSPENILAWAKHSKETCDRMYKIYSEASGKTVAFWRKRCKKDFILTAEQAIKLGLADGYVGS